MKSKDLASLREKSVAQLKKEADKLGVEIMEKRAKISAGKEKNLKLVKNLRKKRAVVLTLIKEKKK